MRQLSENEQLRVSGGILEGLVAIFVSRVISDVAEDIACEIQGDCVFDPVTARD